MKKVLIPCDITTGWTGSTGVTFASVQAPYLSNNYSASLMIGFPATAGAYAEFTFSTPVPVDIYTDLVFHAVSEYLGNDFFRVPSDFNYKIEFQSSVSGFYVPVTKAWEDVSIGLHGVTSIYKIRITSLTAQQDYLTVSSFMLAVQELPLDVIVGIQEQLAFNLAKFQSYSIGSVTCAVGDSSITFATDVPYIDSYACVLLSDTHGNSETHHIQTKNGATFTFSDLFDKEKIVSCTGVTTVALYIPVTYGTTQKQIIIPSIDVWCMTPEDKKITSGLYKVIDQYAVLGTFSEKQEGIYQSFDLMIDCEARQTEILAFLSFVIRKTIGNRLAWFTGKEMWMEFSAPPKETLPTESFNIIPKVEYTCNVIIKEDVFDAQILPSTTGISVDVNISGAN